MTLIDKQAEENRIENRNKMIIPRVFGFFVFR